MSEQASNLQDPENQDQIMSDGGDSPQETQQSLGDPSQTWSPSSPQHSDGQGGEADGGDGDFGAPGSSWNTTKYREDYERAYVTLLDQTWDHSKYGDTAAN
ncbi:hypothetical protein F5884DRAFT_791906 [Xylogone sp. PMI_703]|nr:hypothetical protein F5884DRAFT_791906 [Xylogone sp. PMI_703]